MGVDGGWALGSYHSMITAQQSPNVFLLDVAARPGVALSDVEALLIAQVRDFVPTSRPTIPPEMFSHRVLRREGGVLLWEISFDGLDLPGGDEGSAEDMASAVVSEASSRLAGVADIGAAAACIDLLHPPPDRGFSSLPGVLNFEDEGGAGWEAYARDSGEPEAGAELPSELVDQVRQNREAVPAEPGLKPHGVGHMYGGASDKAHIAYLKDYLQQRAGRASAADRRKVLAFLAFQSREGSTAAINTYDNQIVTWGTGWGGLGWLGKVMERATSSEALRDALGRSGVRYRGKSMYDVVDIDRGVVITGKQEGLEAIRRSIQLLYLLIQVARDPESRDAATEAQLVTFMEGSANISGSTAVATQALFNFITHLKHWAPGYVTGCLEWAVPQVNGDPSPDRDRQLAVLVGRYFYGKAIRTKWVPTWSQFQLYFTRHMKEDGLDCSGEPFIKAASYPTDDPFAAVPLPSAASPTTSTAPAPKPAPVPKPAPAPSPIKAAPAPSPVKAAPAPSPVKAAPSPVEAAPSPVKAAPTAAALKNAPLAGVPALEAIVSTGKGSVRKGDSGAGVKAVQQALIALKSEVPGGADGDFGAGLERAVKAFQSAHGLTADGVVGKGTLSALDGALGNAGARGAT